MRHCIYCKSPLTGRPPREHVIPYAFTRGFRTGNNLCIRCVCEACNRGFGEDLEPVLTEDSFLGMLRYLHGVKTDTRRAPAPDRTRFELRYKGQATDVRAAYDGTGYEVQVVTQVGFPVHGQGGTHRYFRLDQIEAALHDGAIDRTEVEVVACEPGAVQLATKALAAIGIQPRRCLQRPPTLPDVGQADIEIGELQDVDVKRCMAKIAFNYLAYVVSGRCQGRTDWLMSSQFDPLREFALGSRPEWQPRLAVADVRLRPPFGGTGHKGGVAHHAVLQWKRNARDIVATVDLFSWLGWQITLAEDFGAVAFDITSGHFWDIQKKLIGKMQVVRRSLLPFS